MKLIHLIALSSSILLFSFQSDAGLILQDTYVVTSDVEAEDVPEGFCRVKGSVYNNMQAVDSALISTITRVYSTYTDSLGNYSFLISANDTSLFCFKSKSGEVVVWSHHFKSGHEVTIDFYLPMDMEFRVVGKPVLYFYSEKQISTQIQIKSPHDFTFTYPQYQDGWNVEVSQDGLTLDGKEYPYLFWESEDQIGITAKNGVIEGFSFDGINAGAFLEDKLSLLGLNQKEKTDFITFWGPQLVKHKHCFVQFLVDESYDAVATLESTVPIDSERRVYAIFHSSDTEIELQFKEPTLTTFERIGFTVVEWGGSIIPAPKNKI